jgi:archaellum component FlaC
MEKINNDESTNEYSMNDNSITISMMTLHNLKNELENYKKQMNNLQSRIQEIENAIKNLKKENYKL